MNVFKPYSSIARLLSKYLANRMSEKEEQKLFSWRNEGEQNQRLFREITDPSFFRSVREKHHEAEGEAAYRRFRQQLNKRRRQRIIRRVTAAAAVVLLPLAACWIWFVQQEEAGLVGIEPGVIQPGKFQAELVLADGTVQQLGQIPGDTLVCRQQGGTVYAASDLLHYKDDGTAGQQVPYNRLRIPRGGEYLVKLSDGTRIQLNAGSELIYPVTFRGKERQVVLSGEAYFEVAKDSLHPFIVRTSTACIEVLGTAFDVRDYPEDEEMLTTLEQGKVRLTAGNQQVILTPGQQSVCSREGEVEVRKVDTRFYTAWKDGIFAFREERLEDILKIVARWYDVHIFWNNPACKEIVFTGKMHKYDDFSRILDMLSMAGEVRFSLKDRTITVNEK